MTADALRTNAPLAAPAPPKPVRARPGAPSALRRARDAVVPATRAFVARLDETSAAIASYHLGWTDTAGVPTGGDGGKAVRPALATLSAQAVGAPARTGLPGAVAVELVHNFSLVHDDVMDGDVTRRHRPTAWSVFGMNAAILAGDAMLTLAMDVLASSGHPLAGKATGMLSAAVQELVDGQSADMLFERRADVGVAECLGMARKKTGALLGCACALGALFGGGRSATIESYRGFGERLGLAFQVVDDLLGIWGDPATTGKPAHSDLDSRKKSLPVVAALNSGTKAGRELAALYHGERQRSGAELARAAELVDLAGGRQWSTSMADEELRQVLRHLEAAGPGERAAAELVALARLITGRDH
ncbi:MAG: family 2 encapsulin nanocompartment cargo protein polyprenyl transferase [Pseudonocardiaceae bacterium]